MIIIINHQLSKDSNPLTTILSSEFEPFYAIFTVLEILLLNNSKNNSLEPPY